jgi:hypothetical protein
MTGTHDLLGVGIGPFNLSLAALLDPVDGVDAVFFDQADGFAWHPGLLVEGTTTQVPFLADQVTLADPTSRHSFLEYLRAHDRLYRFYLRERFHLPRREYDHYCRWVAGRLAACRFGTRVEGLRWLPGPGLFEAELTEVGSGRTSRRRARNLVLGVGWAPAVPAALAGALGKDVFHAAEFLSYQAVPGLPHDRLLAGELDPATAGGFTATLAVTGADPGDYLWFPVHDWQWEHVVVPLFAPSLAAGDLVPPRPGTRRVPAPAVDPHPDQPHHPAPPPPQAAHEHPQHPGLAGPAHGQDAGRPPGDRVPHRHRGRRPVPRRRPAAGPARRGGQPGRAPPRLRDPARRPLPVQGAARLHLAREPPRQARGG